MEFSKEIITESFTYDHIPALEQFCKQCKSEGYTNNSSIAAMKLDWCLSINGQFFITFFQDSIISLSGCHPLPEAGTGIYRTLFRGVTLPRYRNMLGSMSKSHMNSIPFLYHLPRQIAWAEAMGYKKFVVTTNHNNSISSMEKSHRVFKLLERQQLVSCMYDNLLLFNVNQSVWDLNLDQYYKVREEFLKRNNVT